MFEEAPICAWSMHSFIYKYYFFLDTIIYRMNRFTDYLHNKIHKDQKQSQRIINVFKRVSNVMTDDKHEYDDFSFLIKDKEKIRTWLLKNLSLSSVVSYSISLRHSCWKHRSTWKQGRRNGVLLSWHSFRDTESYK